MDCQQEDLSKFHCNDCLFVRRAKVPDKARPYVPGMPRERVDGFVCAIRPPVAGANRPVTFRSLVCAYWTDAKGNQPLRHLLDGEPAHARTVSTDGAMEGSAR